MPNSFTRNHFGKTLDEEIVADDLISYFCLEREESLTLEFKSYKPDKNGGFSFDGVLRTISAFLNSEGGLLVFGAPTDTAMRNGYRAVQGELTPIPSKIITKDGLVNKISDGISYLPVGIRVESIQFSDGSFVYLVEVQESENKPHQFNKQYPIRLDGQSKAAPHYIVEALFKQLKAPELKGYLRITSYRFSTLGPERRIILGLETTIFNTTKSVNDTKVYIQLTSSKGTFVDNLLPNFIHRLGVVVVNNPSQIITFALPTVCHFTFEIDSREFFGLMEHNLPVELSLVFGSSQSITRRSSYSIFLKNIVTTDIVNETFKRPIDLNNLLAISKEENVSMNELWKNGEKEWQENVLKGI